MAETGPNTAVSTINENEVKTHPLKDKTPGEHENKTKASSTLRLQGTHLK